MSKLDREGRSSEVSAAARIDVAPGAESPQFERADDVDDTEVARLAAQIDLADPRSILFYGADAQRRLTALSDQMLEGVRAKDAGSAGGSLSELVTTLKGFDVERLDPNRKPGLVSRILGRGRPIVRFLREYEAVRDQVESISGALERHKTRLLTDVTALDRLYAANLESFRALSTYIAAGQAKLRELDEGMLAALDERIEAGGDMLEAQRLKDVRAARDDLERRVHDLELTRQVSMQALPSIRLVQESDKGLINKISSTLVNTVPLWRQQLAQAVTIYRSAEAAGTLKAAADLTNDLLRANAESLKGASAEARRQIERGVFDIETVRQANETLIEAIEESLSIAAEGRRARVVASEELVRLEADLEGALAAAARGYGAARPE